MNTLKTAGNTEALATDEVIDAQAARQLLFDLGAEDVGFVEIDRPALAEEAAHIRRHIPWAKALISFVVRMNREPMRSTARSIANVEFHSADHAVDAISRAVVTRFEREGLRALSPSMGFPMEMDNFPGRLWVVSHKPVAVEAGLGQQGVHRNVIHPKFGSFVYLGTIVVASEISEYSRPIDFSPCFECKLCVAACPVGAISPKGEFNFANCYTHNYREFMGGFTDLIETAADSKSRKQFQKRFTGAETVSFWQSLSYGANYKAAYCIAACPAGEEVIAPFKADKPKFIRETVKPLQAKEENVYVIKNSDAEKHVKKRFPHKRIRYTPNTLRPENLAQFIDGMPLVFQGSQAGDLDAVYHFRFTGEDEREITVVIRKRRVTVSEGLGGEPDLKVTADSRTWVKFLRQEVSITSALLRLKVRVHGNPILLIKFGKCFPN